MPFEEVPISEEGRVIYDDDVARSLDIGGDRFRLECAARAVACDAPDLIEAATHLIRKVGGRLSILEAVRLTVEDLEYRIAAQEGRQVA